MYNLKHKWIFVHPEKCGGTSIECILRRKHKEGLVDITGEDQHYGISDYANLVENDLDEYFVFGCIRNPWDRMVSLYYHAIKWNDYDLPFENYIRPRRLKKMKVSAENKFLIDGEFKLDYVIQLEDFADTTKVALNKIGILDYELPHYDHQTNRPKVPYQQYYTDETKSWIEEVFQWDIKYFNYAFE